MSTCVYKQPNCKRSIKVSLVSMWFECVKSMEIQSLNGPDGEIQLEFHLTPIVFEREREQYRLRRKARETSNSNRVCKNSTTQLRLSRGMRDGGIHKAFKCLVWKTHCNISSTPCSTLSMKHQHGLRDI